MPVFQHEQELQIEEPKANISLLESWSKGKSHEKPDQFGLMREESI